MMSTANSLVSSRCTTRRDRKRKLSFQSNECCHHRTLHPGCINTNNVLISSRPPAIQHEDMHVASFESLPQELFCSVVGYLGPTSTTLCMLAQLTRAHGSLLKTIGDIMLPVARARFRIPLPPKSECESSISLFVRHARIAKDVHDQLSILEDCLNKEFPTSQMVKDITFPRAENFVTADELDHALDVALCLLGAGQCSHLYSGSNCRIANYVATTVLEWRVSKLCAALGANAYKYVNEMMRERDVTQPNSYVQVTDEYNQDEDECSVSSFHSEDENIYRLDKACMVMQLTMARDFEIVRQVRLAGGMTILPSRYH